MAVDADGLRQQIIDEEVLDPEGLHHEFVSGLHGRKLDFDLIPDDSNLFNRWVETVCEKLKELYPEEVAKGLVIISVANGTNRVVPLVAGLLGNGSISYLTEKVSPKAVKLVDGAEAALKASQPEFAVIIEDVGTKGTTSASAAKSALASGVKRVEVLNTWQRRDKLEELDAIDVKYNAVIFELLPTLDPEECNKTGYCAQGWQYIEHAK
jgi:hypothetical protein